MKRIKITRAGVIACGLAAAVWTVNAVLGLWSRDQAVLRTLCAAGWWLALFGNLGRFRRQRAEETDG